MAFSMRDADRVAEILHEAARTEIMPRFRHLGAGAIREKTSAEDLVTDADVAAEKFIAAALTKAFPGAIVIGEEGVSARPALLDELEGSGLAFVVDPVDGTKNFASGLPLFGVMAAAIEKGEIVGGVILDPVGGDWSVAARGEGAFTVTAEGSRMPLTVADPLAAPKMSGTASWSTLPEPLRSQVCANLARTRSAANYRCAAHEYRMIAAGSSHFALFSKINVWDHAAGWILHREAGGHTARFDASPYLPGHRDGGLLCAPSEEAWHDLHKAIFQGTQYAG